MTTFKFFVPQPHTLSEGKALYKKLCMENHPDLGGSVEAMQAINAEWDYLKSRLPRFDTGIHTDFNARAEAERAKQAAVDAELRPMVDKLNAMGIDFEILGKWIWSADKRAAKAGMIFSERRQMWYWRPESAKETSRGSRKSYDWIRAKYGAQSATTRRRETITA